MNAHLKDCVFVLHDLDAARNSELASVCRLIARKLGSTVRVETEDLLENALIDAVILCISTGGLDAMEHDIEIPKKYGIYQPVGDSTGPVGISRTLRNLPPVTLSARKMEELMLREHTGVPIGDAVPGKRVNLSEQLSGDQVKFALFKIYGALPYPGDRHLVEFFPHFLSEKTNHGADFGVGLTSVNDRRTHWINGFRKRIAE